MQRKFSRRHFLQGSAVVAGGAGLVMGSDKAEAKVAQSVVHYQDSPHNSEQCDGCNYFEPPHACKLVQGPISPHGWCTLWTKKT